MLNFNPQTVSLCVIQQHHDFWAPLVAFDWASGLICIIRISQLWNSFDLPPSLVTEWDRVSLLPPSRLPFSPSSIHHTHFFTVLHVHYLFPWCPNLFFTHIVVILCSFQSPAPHQLVFITLRPAPYVFAVEYQGSVGYLAFLFPVQLSPILTSRRIELISLLLIPQGRNSTLTHWKTHAHTHWVVQGEKMGCCLSGEMSPGKCFPSHESPSYHHNLQPHGWRWQEDVISLPNDRHWGLPHHLVIWKVISL